MPEKNRGALPVSQHNKSAYEVGVYAAAEAGKILRRRLGKNNATHIKGKRNIVTEADLQAEKKIIEIIHEEFPQHGILSEESGKGGADSDYTWVIDPLDGTNNYFFGIPLFCTNIALARGKDIILGLTYDPIRKELFHSEVGKGAFLNNRRIHVSGVAGLNEASIGIDLGYKPEISREILERMNKLWPQVYCLRLMGSASLGMAYVACGRLSLYFHKSIYPWDIASGLLLVREAGGEVENGDRKRAVMHDTQIYASNNILLDKFFRWLSFVE